MNKSQLRCSPLFKSLMALFMPYNASQTLGCSDEDHCKLSAPVTAHKMSLKRIFIYRARPFVPIRNKIPTCEYGLTITVCMWAQWDYLKGREHEDIVVYQCPFIYVEDDITESLFKVKQLTPPIKIYVFLKGNLNFAVHHTKRMLLGSWSHRKWSGCAELQPKQQYNELLPIFPNKKKRRTRIRIFNGTRSPGSISVLQEWLRQCYEQILHCDGTDSPVKLDKSRESGVLNVCMVARLYLKCKALKVPERGGGGDGAAI